MDSLLEALKFETIRPDFGITIKKVDFSFFPGLILSYHKTKTTWRLLFALLSPFPR